MLARPAHNTALAAHRSQSPRFSAQWAAHGGGWGCKPTRPAPRATRRHAATRRHPQRAVGATDGARGRTSTAQTAQHVRRPEQRAGSVRTRYFAPIVGTWVRTPRRGSARSGSAHCCCYCCCQGAVEGRLARPGWGDARPVAVLSPRQPRPRSQLALGNHCTRRPTPRRPKGQPVAGSREALVARLPPRSQCPLLPLSPLTTMLDRAGESAGAVRGG